MNNRYYFCNSLEVKSELNKCTSKYSNDYMYQLYFIKALITFGEFNYALELLNSMENKLIRNNTFKSNLVSKTILDYKIEIYFYLEDFNNIRNIFKSNPRLLKNHKYFYISNYISIKDGLISESDNYKLKQLINYDKTLFINRTNVGRKLLNEMYLNLNTNRVYYDNLEDNYIFKYGKSYYKVICLHNTYNIIYIEIINNGFNYNYIDLTYIDYNSNIKRLSQIDRFNKRYKGV